MHLTVRDEKGDKVFESGPKTHEEAMSIIFTECFDLRIKKHNDYGPDGIMAFGEFGLLVRIFDKLNRLKNLLKPGFVRKVIDESIEDTWKDVLNYALMALMVRRGWFTLPTKANMPLAQRADPASYGWSGSPMSEVAKTYADKELEKG